MLRFLLILVMMCQSLTCAGQIIEKPSAKERIVHRLAFVVGNRTYPDLPWTTLNSPEKDATDVSALLSDNGYSVKVLKNATASALKVNSIRFLIKIDDLRADIIERKAEKTESIAVIFYFSGHGYSNGGNLYLAGVDGKGKYLEDLADSSMLLSAISDRMFVDDQVELLSFLFVDACRTPLGLPSRIKGNEKGSRFKGSLFSTASGSGGVVLFASRDGRPSIDGKSQMENSIFTQAFLASAKNSDASAGIWTFLNNVAVETRRISLAQGFNPPQLAEIRGTPLTDVRFKGAATTSASSSSLPLPESGKLTLPNTTLVSNSVGPSPGKDVGWIWLGNYTGTSEGGGSWTRNIFAGKSAATIAPSAIKAGSKYTASTAVYLRKDFPEISRCKTIPTSGNYAECTPEVGVIEFGGGFEITGPLKAVPINKGYTQYWAPVVRSRSGEKA